MKVALAQIECPWGTPEGNLHEIERVSREAARESADLVAFPELTVSGIMKMPEVKEFAEPADGPSVRRVRAISRSLGIAIGFGFTERAEPLPRNAYCLAGKGGEVAGIYRKMHIPKLEVPFWQGGDESPVFELLGRRWAVAICWDATYPELLAGYAREGADVVLMPHAWDADPLDTSGEPLGSAHLPELEEHRRAGRLGGWKTHHQMRDHFYSYIPDYAREHGFAVLFVNQCGQPHPCLRFEGPTFAVDRAGEVLVETEDGGEQLLYAELE